jgi:Mn-containing catalase
LRSNIAAESRAKIVYERLINLTDDPGIKDALGFLMTREIAHQKSFEKALYAIADNFPPGKLPGLKPFADTYVNTSQGGVEQNGPWNSGKQWDRVDDLEAALPADGGDGDATVQLSSIDTTALKALATRTMSQQGGDQRPEPIWALVLAQERSLTATRVARKTWTKPKQWRKNERRRDATL